jgi:hypothetical protein
MRGAAGLLPGGPFTGIVVTGLLVLTCIVLAIAFYKLFSKAGLPGVIGLLMLVPVVNLGVALYLAFVEWPVLAELKRVKLQLVSLMDRSQPQEESQQPVTISSAEPAVPAGA